MEFRRSILSLVTLLSFIANSFGQLSNSMTDQLEHLKANYEYQKIIDLLEGSDSLSNWEQQILAEAQYKSGLYSEALKNYQMLYTEDSTRSYLLQEAKIYEKMGNKEEAFLIYRSIAFENKDNPYYWKLAAQEAKELARFDIALGFYHTAYELSPNDQGLVFNYTSLLTKLEYYDNADSILSTEIPKHPQATNLKRQKLLVLYRQKRYQALVEESEILFAKGDSNLMDQKLAGIANYHTKDFEKSIHLLSNVVEIEKESDFLHYYLGLAYRETGETKKAAELLERSIDLAVSNNLPNYYTQLAISYEEDKQTAKAIQAYKIAYKETKDKVLLYHLARNYDILYKDKKVALNYYQKYLDEKDTANEYLMNYSEHRIQELKAATHFEVDSL